jgi:hypothetical protein
MDGLNTSSIDSFSELMKLHNKHVDESRPPESRNLYPILVQLELMCFFPFAHMLRQVPNDYLHDEEEVGVCSYMLALAMMKRWRAWAYSKDGYS